MGIALPRALAISSATAPAAPLFRSAMPTLPPSRAKVSAISFPMPLAAPVTMATLSFRRMVPLRMGLLRAARRSSDRLGQVIVHDFAVAERQIRKKVDRRDDLDYWQLCDRGECVRGQY